MSTERDRDTFGCAASFFFFFFERDDHRLTIPTVSSLVAQFLTSSKELGIGDTRVSISRARLNQEHKGGVQKKKTRKKEEEENLETDVDL